MSDFKNQIQWRNENGEAIPFEQMHKLAMNGDYYAMFELAMAYRYNPDIKNDRKALHWFNQLPYLNEPFVLHEIGMIELEMGKITESLFSFERGRDFGHEMCELMSIVARVKYADSKLETFPIIYSQNEALLKSQIFDEYNLA